MFMALQQNNICMLFALIGIRAMKLDTESNCTAEKSRPQMFLRFIGCIQDKQMGNYPMIHHF